MDEKSDDKSTLKKKIIAKDIFFVAFSNVIKLLSGVMIGFVLPKIMGEFNYGFYKTYTLYLGYVGIFHFGFCDGIYLLYAGKEYAELSKNEFRYFSRFLFCFESLIGVFICIISLFFINTEFGFIFFFEGISLIAVNITSYYQYISQVTKRFKELSIRNIIQAILQILSVLVLYFAYKFGKVEKISFKIYVVINTVLLVALAIWYIFTYRSITFGKINKSSKKDIVSFRKSLLKFFKVGFPLMIANLASSLIMTIDKQFVNILATQGIIEISDFGVYAFAYNMLGLITTIIAAISTVLYPTIKIYSEEKLKQNYIKLISYIAIITGICSMAYQPLCFIVNTWLKEYSGSLPIFRAILPGIVVSSCITMIMFNYYKALNKQFLFFIISVGVLGLSFLFDFLAFYFSANLVWISYASVIVIFLWYFVSEFYLFKKWKFNNIRNILYIFLLVISFYLITYLIENSIISMLVYFVSFSILTISFHYQLVKTFFNGLCKK